MALVYVGLEDNDRAFEWLEKAFEARSWELPMLKASPLFDDMRSDPQVPCVAQPDRSAGLIIYERYFLTSIALMKGNVPPPTS